MINRLLATILSAALLTPAGAGAVETSLQLQIGGETGDFERRTVLYDCSEGEPFAAIYIDAAPNFLALVPIAGEPELRIFAAVESAFGARYAAGPSSGRPKAPRPAFSTPPWATMPPPS